MVQKLAASTLLSVSEKCCLFYLREGTTQRTVADIATAAGISERTFYRYFPVKAESIAPVFDAMTETMNAVVSARSDDPLRTLLIRAFEAMFATPVTARARELFPLVFADPEMWALFLRKVHDGEVTLAPLLAGILGLPVGHVRARAAAAGVASATRIALERLSIHGTEETVPVDLSSAFIDVLDAFGPALVRPASTDALGDATDSASSSTG